MKESTTLQKFEIENPDLVNEKYIVLLKEENNYLASENSELRTKLQELESQIEKMKNCDNCKNIEDFLDGKCTYYQCKYKNWELK